MADSQPSPAMDQRSAFGDKYHSLMIEQYKLYVESSSKISERRGNAHTFLMTANTALVTVYSLASGKGAPVSPFGTVWQILVPIAGLILTFAWILLIRSYRAINSAKFSVILSIEQGLPVQCFGQEWAYRERSGSGLDLTLAEQFVPLAFAGLYLTLAIASLV